jgi:hypothetical protein
MFFMDTSEKIAWYNNLRPIHSLIYLAFAFYAVRGYVGDAWKILLVDTGFGVLTYTIYSVYSIRAYESLPIKIVVV